MTREGTGDERPAVPIAAEVEHLLAIVDMRLRLLARLQGSPPSSAREAPDAAALLDGRVLDDLAAPFFGHPPARAAGRMGRRMLDLPVRVFGLPQHYFNVVVRKLFGALGPTLEHALAMEAALAEELASQEARLAVLEARTGAPARPALLAARPPRRAESPLVVGIVSRVYPPNPHAGGIARYSQILAQALAAAGHAVHVLTEGGSSARHEHERVTVHGVTPDVIPVVPSLPSVDRMLRWSLAVAARVMALDRAGTHLDVIESGSWEAEGLALRRLGAIPIAVRVHTPALVVARHAGWPPSPDVDLAIALERWLVAHADGVSGSTEGILRTAREDLGPLPPDEPVVRIPLGVPAPPPAPSGGDDRALRLLFVGRLEARKGIDVLLAALPALLDRFPALSVDVVGDDGGATAGRPTARTAFEARHRDAPWRARCRFHGLVDDARLEDFYRRCDVFVAPSRFESFGLVYVEAMRWGKPVVGCRVGGVPEVVADGETGLLVPPDDPTALEAALGRLLADRGLRERLGRRARDVVASAFSTRLMAERTASFYADLIGRRATAPS